MPQAFFTDELRTPLHYAIASRILIRLAESETRGLIHVGGPERLSRYELMRRVASVLGIDPHLVQPNVRADVPLVEPRPADVSLNSSRLISPCSRTSHAHKSKSPCRQSVSDEISIPVRHQITSCNTAESSSASPSQAVVFEPL